MQDFVHQQYEQHQKSVYQLHQLTCTIHFMRESLVYKPFDIISTLFQAFFGLALSQFAMEGACFDIQIVIQKLFVINRPIGLPNLIFMDFPLIFSVSFCHWSNRCNTEAWLECRRLGAAVAGTNLAALSVAVLGSPRMSKAQRYWI